MALILICISVIILCAPGRAPWTTWIAGVLAVVALVLALLGTRHATLLSVHTSETGQQFASQEAP